jgi:ABC-type glucose/galactose transport system permease subunit
MCGEMGKNCANFLSTRSDMRTIEALGVAGFRLSAGVTWISSGKT